MSKSNNLTRNIEMVKAAKNILKKLRPSITQNQYRAVLVLDWTVMYVWLKIFKNIRSNLHGNTISTLILINSNTPDTFPISFSQLLIFTMASCLKGKAMVMGPPVSFGDI